MPLVPPRHPPRDQRDWDQWARAVDVIPNAGSVSTEKLQDDAVTDAKLRESAGTSVIGRSVGMAGNPGDITATADDVALQRLSGSLTWAAMSASSVTFTPTGGITATFVDTALAELDSEKAGIADAETISGLWSFTTPPTINGGTVWHSGNDGAASTLDADLLDGQHGSYYQNADNLNAGSIPNARVPQSAVTQHQAALAIAETQITDGAILARIGANETVSGAWTFTAAVRIDNQHSTGAATATFSAANKPGANNKTSPDTWIKVNLGGTDYYIPAFLA